MTQLNIEGIYNIRDLGGFPVERGGTTRHNCFVRAGNMDQVPPMSQKQLTDYGVKTVIDLRDEWETRDYPNVFAQSPRVGYMNVPLIGDALSQSEGWQSHTQEYDSLQALYSRYLHGCQPQIGQIFTRLAESPSTVIFHCYAGKDRTGIIAALLLALVGVADEHIAQDYALSEQEIPHLIAQWRAYARMNKLDLQKVERDSASHPATITGMLHELRAQHGTVSDYLQVCGVDEDHLTQLRAHFVEA